MTALTWTSDGTKLLEGAADGTFSVWTSSGSRLSESTHHADGIRSIVVSADGKLAASVASDAALLVVSVRSPARPWDADPFSLPLGGDRERRPARRARESHG